MNPPEDNYIDPPDPSSDGKSPGLPENLLLIAVKEAIAGFLQGSPGEVTLSAMDIAERVRHKIPGAFSERWLQIQIGRLVNKYKLGEYVGRPSDQRLYEFNVKSSGGNVKSSVTQPNFNVTNPQSDTNFSVTNPKSSGGNAKSNGGNIETAIEKVPSAIEKVPSAIEILPKKGILPVSAGGTCVHPAHTDGKVSTDTGDTVVSATSGILENANGTNIANGENPKSKDGFDLARSLEEILEERVRQVPGLIELATAEDYDAALKAIAAVDDRVLREEYLKQLSRKLKLPRKLFKDRVREWLHDSKVPHGSAQDADDRVEYVECYNERFAVLIGGNAGVLNLQHKDLVIYGVSEFVNLVTANETSLVCNERGVMREIGKGQLWLKHPKRKEYQGVEFQPNGDTPGFYNLWSGFPVAPDKDAGKFGCFRELVDRLICNGNKSEQRFVWNWMASLFQFPGEKQGTAIAIRGKKGCGKTVFGEVLHMLLGRYYILADKEEHVSGRFNAHLAHCLLLHCDETFFTGNQRAAGTVKSIITSPTHTIERKGRDPICVQNYTRILITSEKDRICSADEEERRYAVFEISQKRQNDISFFRRLFEELKCGGIKSLMAYLLSRKVEDRLGIPHNKALADQQAQNLDAVAAYLVHLCSEAVLPDTEIYYNVKNQLHEERIRIVSWSDTETVVVRKSAVYDHFKVVTPKTSYIPHAVQFFSKISFLLPGDLKTVQPRDRDQRRCYIFPPRNYIHARLSERLGITIEQ